VLNAAPEQGSSGLQESELSGINHAKHNQMPSSILTRRLSAKVEPTADVSGAINAHQLPNHPVNFE
jgi:hypothetical protein